MGLAHGQHVFIEARERAEIQTELCVRAKLVAHLRTEIVIGAIEAGEGTATSRAFVPARTGT